MHKSLWDTAAPDQPLETAPTTEIMPLTCIYSCGRDKDRTCDRWCVKLALPVERRPYDSHLCTSAAICRLPASQPCPPVAARLGTLGGHWLDRLGHARRAIQQTP